MCKGTYPLLYIGDFIIEKSIKMIPPSTMDIMHIRKILINCGYLRMHNPANNQPTFSIHSEGLNDTSHQKAQEVQNDIFEPTYMPKLVLAHKNIFSGERSRLIKSLLHDALLYSDNDTAFFLLKSIHSSSFLCVS